MIGSESELFVAPIVMEFVSRLDHEPEPFRFVLLSTIKLVNTDGQTRTALFPDLPIPNVGLGR